MLIQEKITFEIAQESNMPPAAKGAHPVGNPIWEHGCRGYVEVPPFLRLSMERTLSK